MQAAARSRRSDILSAARREFATAGFAGARIERIAAAAAVNKQLLFHYFESKEGLFAAALAELLAGLEARPAQSDSPAAQIRGVVSELVAAVRSLPGIVAILADARSNPEFPEQAAALVAGWRGRLLGRLAAALRDGQKRGYFRDDIDPDGMAAVALAAALGVVAVDGAGSPGPAFEEYLPGMLVEHCAWR